MVVWIGRWLFAVGVIHLSFGVLFMRATLAVLWYPKNKYPQSICRDLAGVQFH